jgi:phosphate/sulfate permease
MNLAVATVVVVALVFDFVNGFHDAANSIATSCPHASCRRAMR